MTMQEQPASDPIVFSIGEISVSQHWVVTPDGNAPIAGSKWMLRDNTNEEIKVPTWAIVLCVLTALETCGLGLLFLLVKERKMTGTLEVSVRAGDLEYFTQIRPRMPKDVHDVTAKVSTARQMAQAA